MAYTPNTWATGDVVTSAKLNNIEQGIANSVFIVNFTWNEGTETYSADKTYAEVAAAYAAGIPVFAWLEGDALVGMYERENQFEAHSVYATISESSAQLGIEVLTLKSDDTVTEEYGEYTLS